MPGTALTRRRRRRTAADLPTAKQPARCGRRSRPLAPYRTCPAGLTTSLPCPAVLPPWGGCATSPRWRQQWQRTRRPARAAEVGGGVGGKSNPTTCAVLAAQGHCAAHGLINPTQLLPGVSTGWLYSLSPSLSRLAADITGGCSEQRGNESYTLRRNWPDCCRLDGLLPTFAAALLRLNTPKTLWQAGSGQRVFPGCTPTRSHSTFLTHASTSCTLQEDGGPRAGRHAGRGTR